MPPCEFERCQAIGVCGNLSVHARYRRAGAVSSAAAAHFAGNGASGRLIAWNRLDPHDRHAWLAVRAACRKDWLGRRPLNVDDGFVHVLERRSLASPFARGGSESTVGPDGWTFRQGRGSSGPRWNSEAARPRLGLARPAGWRRLGEILIRGGELSEAAVLAEDMGRQADLRLEGFLLSSRVALARGLPDEARHWMDLALAAVKCQGTADNVRRLVQPYRKMRWMIPIVLVGIFPLSLSIRSKVASPE
jgi:hypothetical protein